MRKSSLIVFIFLVLSFFGTQVFSAPQEYGKVAIVAKSGGGYVDPVTAMNSLATWCGIPSFNNPCLLKIMPGIYDLETNSIQMQPYVDIEGSGENSTKITSTIDSSLAGVVRAVSNSEIRRLTLENRSTNFYEQPTVLTASSASPKLSHVTVQGATGGYYNNIGIFADNTNAIISDVTVTSVATGIQLNGGSPRLNNIAITDANLAILNTGSAANMNGLFIKGCGTGIQNFYSGPIVTNSTIVETGSGITNSAGGGIQLKNVVISVMNTAVINNSFGGSAGDVSIDHSEIVSLGPIFNIEFGSIRVAQSKLSGGSALVDPASCKYLGVYDGNYDPISCPMQ